MLMPKQIKPDKILKILKEYSYWETLPLIKSLLVKHQAECTRVAFTSIFLQIRTVTLIILEPEVLVVFVRHDKL
jgi:hypothetical protein